MALTNLVILHLLIFFCVQSWDYGHPDNWHQSFPSCASKDESPINIETEKAIINSTQCDATFDWQIDYDHTMFKVINNAHSLQIVALGLNEEESSNYTASKNLDEYTRLSSNYDTIATFPNYFRAHTYSAHRLYCLDSFHFHWGSNSEFGSEHTINGQHFPLEAHFLHYACDELNFKQAMYTYDNSLHPDYYVLAVVAVLFQVTKENNPAFDAILNDSVIHKITIPDDLQTPNITGYDIIDNLDLHDLIPSNIYTDGYYGYQGSLTTPPCTDVVRWYLMKATGSIGEEQLEKLRLLMNDNGHPITDNYREIQKEYYNVWECKDQEMQNSLNRTNSMSSISVVLVSLASSICIGTIFVFCISKCNKHRMKRGESESKRSEAIIRQYSINNETSNSSPESYVLMY